MPTQNGALKWVDSNFQPPRGCETFLSKRDIWFEEGECKIRCGSCNYIFELEKKKKKLVEKLIIFIN